MTALLYAAPYRLARITAYMDFWAEPQGNGYQPLQSLTTIASGGWLGTGLGSGVQKYGYLPESHSDFVFAVICEEMGLFGAALVIALYGVLVWLGLRTMLAAPSRFERMLAFGLTATFGLQAVMNIAVVTVVTPTTGISLPLISAGGSGVLTFCLAAGVLAAVAIRGRVCEAIPAGVHAAPPREDSPVWTREAAPW
jgi:cell division protein FtsW